MSISLTRSELWTGPSPSLSRTSSASRAVALLSLAVLNRALSKLASKLKSLAFSLPPRPLSQVDFCSCLGLVWLLIAHHHRPWAAFALDMDNDETQVMITVMVMVLVMGLVHPFSSAADVILVIVECCRSWFWCACVLSYQDVCTSEPRSY